METDEYTNTTNAFLSWLSGRGLIISPSMELVDLRSEGRGRGAVAVSDIEVDEVVFSVPRSAVLNIGTANQHLDGELQKAIAKMPPWLALTTIMLAEGANENSQWAQYFSILPRELDSLVFWSQSELAELHGSTVVRKIGKDSAEEMFAKHISPLGIPNATLEMCHRVSSIIMAYAFDIPEKPNTDDVEDTNDDDGDLISDDGEDEKTTLSMIPLADMLNADAHRNNVRLCCDGEDLEMRTIKPIKKGEEILNDYGELPRADLLRRYGYVTDNYTPYDVAEISTESLLSIVCNDQLMTELCQQQVKALSQEEVTKRVGLAERENVFDNSYDVCLPGSDIHSIPDELVALTYLLLLADDHLKSIESSEDALPSRSKICTQLVGQILGQLFRMRENDYMTTIEEDEKLLLAGNLTRRATMAIKVRLGEKQVLRKAIETASNFTGSNRKMKILPQTDLSGQSRKRRQDDATQPKKKGRHG